jgi:hypothetical protein
VSNLFGHFGPSNLSFGIHQRFGQTFYNQKNQHKCENNQYHKQIDISHNKGNYFLTKFRLLSKMRKIQIAHQLVAIVAKRHVGTVIRVVVQSFFLNVKILVLSTQLMKRLHVHFISRCVLESLFNSGFRNDISNVVVKENIGKKRISKVDYFFLQQRIFQNFRRIIISKSLPHQQQ